MIPAESLKKNTMTITTAFILQKIFSFIYFWFLSNYLLAENLGKYIFALSFASLFSIFLDLHITPIVIREASKNLQQANRLLQNTLSLKIPLAAFTLLLVAFFIQRSPKPPEVQMLVILASLVLILESFTMSFWGIFRAFQNMFFESLSIVGVQLLILILGLFALFTTKNLFFLMGVLLIAGTANFVFSLTLIKFRLRFSLKPRWDKGIIRHLMRHIPVFALGGIFAKIYLTSDSVLLGLLANDSAVGFYSIPTKVITALSQVIPAALATALFPVFSKYARHSQEKLRHIFQQAVSYLIFISLPITFGIIILLPNILTTLWPAYQDVLQTFSLMTVALPFVFLAFATGYFLNACDKQKYNTINRGIMSVLSIILNILLIPAYSYLGAGITFLTVNIIVFFLDIFWVKKTIPLNFSDFQKTFTKTLLACIIMTGVLWYLRDFLHIIILIMIGGMIYFLASILMKNPQTYFVLKIVKK